MPRWTLVVSVTAALLHYGPELLESYPPGLDESWMLQAGHRLFNGRGFTSHLHSAWTDLSSPTYRHLYHWTPLHGWMFAGLLGVTGDTQAALRGLILIKLLSATVGMLGWLRLGQRVLPAQADLAAYAVGLSGLFFAGGADAGPPHLFFWAMLPWAITAVQMGSEQSRLAPILAAGLLTALAVGFRYHAVYLVPGLGLATILLWRSGPDKSRLRRWLAGVAVGLPAVLMLVGISAYNAAGQAPTSWASVTLRQTNQWQNLLYPEPLSFLTVFGFGVEAALVKLRPSWQQLPVWYWLLWDATILGVAVAVGLAPRVCPSSWARSGAGAPPITASATAATDPETARGPAAASHNLIPRAFLCITGSLVVWLLTMLAVVSYRGTPEPGWMPIGERRLYGELLPAVGLTWVLILGRWLRRDRLGLTVVGLLAVLVALPVLRPILRVARQDFRRIRTVAEVGVGGEPQTVSRVRQLAARGCCEYPDAVPIVFDTDTGVPAYLRIENAIRSEQFFVPEHLTTSGSSRPLFVMVVVRHARGNPNFWPTHLGRAYAEYFGLASQGFGQADPEVEIYAGHVWPYRPTTRPQRRDVASATERTQSTSAP